MNESTSVQQACGCMLKHDKAPFLSLPTSSMSFQVQIEKTIKQSRICGGKSQAGNDGVGDTPLVKDTFAQTEESLQYR